MTQPASTENSRFQLQVERLHQLAVGGRWLVVGVLWFTVGLLSLWDLQPELALWQDHFTWVAVRYGLVDHPLATLGLGLCLGMTTGVLVWQSRNILFGRPKRYQQRLEQMVLRIRQQGTSHPLAKWIGLDSD